MQIKYEFRVNEKDAHLLFGPNEGIRLGDSVRKIVLRENDPRLPEVGRLRKKLDAAGKGCFYYSWDIRYRYSRAELEAAELFHLQIRAVFEPPGEMCGTQYDYSNACRICRAGRRQVSDLILDLRRVPKKKDIASTINNDEWIVSQRLAELIIDARLTGFKLRAVRHKALYDEDPLDLRTVPTGREMIRRAEARNIEYGSDEFYVWLNRLHQRPYWDKALAERGKVEVARARRTPKPQPVWYQLIVVSRPVLMAPPTKFGVEPFDEDQKGDYRCPLGHVSGHNLLSEISVKREDWEGADICMTKDRIHFPHKTVQVVPRPLLLVSPRFARLLGGSKIRGCMLEVAHLV